MNRRLHRWLASLVVLVFVLPRAAHATDDPPPLALPTEPSTQPDPSAPEAPLLAGDDLRDSDPLEPSFSISPEGVRVRGTVGLFGVTGPLSASILSGGVAGTFGVQLDDRFGLELGARAAYGSTPQLGGSLLFDMAPTPMVSIAVGPTVVSNLREGEYAIYGSIRTQFRTDRVGQRAARRRVGLIFDVWLEPGVAYGARPAERPPRGPEHYFAFGGGLGFGVGWF